MLTGLAAHFVKDGLMDEVNAKKAFHAATQQNLSFVYYLVKNKLLTSDEIALYCSKNFDLPWIDLSNTHYCIDEKILSLELIQHYEIIPLESSQGTIKIGLADPTNQQAIDAAMFYTSSRISPVIISVEQLHYFIEKNSASSNFIQQIDKKLWDELEDELPVAKENTENYDEPLIKLVDNLIDQAIQRLASDIHIEPYEHFCRIRYRQQGILCEATEIPQKFSHRLITRLKVLAKLDISERRLPQDGRIQHRQMDIRINTCPTLFGEKVVLRLLNSNPHLLDIHSLGMTEQQKTIFIDKISKPQGMILVTGPTGSGKTATLHSALHFLNTPEKNISTVEDPIEIQLPGINQVNVQPKIGLTFSTVLRTFLRQDPDIIMVGEIRDTETANIAIQAAQTGHLVLSTLHTNNAIETLTRLLTMGIPAYHIASSISLIIAQRLVRILCPYCKQKDAHALSVYQAHQCDRCFQGYQGRIGIYEFLPITQAITQLITQQADSKIIQATAKQEGFLSLQEIGYQKALDGITSLIELNRVINP